MPFSRLEDVSAIILAAGVGSRLRPFSEASPKCLMELEPGTSILDFILERVRRAGLKRIIVVTRSEFSHSFRARLPNDVELVELDLDSFENLYSLWMAAGRVDGNFLVLMSDHIFEYELLRRVLNKAVKAQEAFVLCLDKEPSVIEAEEGLKLMLLGGRIVEADKSLKPLYGIDTGIIYCNPHAKKYIEEAIRLRGSKATIKDALNLAAAEDQVGFIDVTGLLWKDVDTPRDLEKARKLYWRILRKELTKPGDGLVSRYLNRQISSRISTALYRRRLYIDPNIISIASFLICVCGAVFLALRSLLIGGLLIQASSIIDGVDGELARLFKRVSRFGALLDSFLDRLADLSVIMGLIIALWPLDQITGIASILASANIILVSYLTLLLQGNGIDASQIRFIPVTRDVRLFVVFLATILGIPLIALLYIAFVPLAYYVAGLILAARHSIIEVRPTIIGREEPWPQLLQPIDPIKAAISKLIGRILKLILVLLILRLIGPIFFDFPVLVINGELLLAEHITLILEAAFVLGFGYAIISSMRGLLDFIAVRLVSRIGATKETLRRIFMDFLYAVLGLIAWCYSVSFASIPAIGGLVSKIAMAAAAILFLMTIYRLGRRTYRTFAEVYEKFVENLARKLAHE
ncbi:MAG: NTP transferase domain-containing protein [Thaumarchaeota archaeon]|jgi:choline kinase/phosphatidylglycerophosphate synthase|nr:NTP transferase domain-containing protein [Candidatus Wolframiiraptor allenii]